MCLASELTLEQSIIQDFSTAPPWIHLYCQVYIIRCFVICYMCVVCDDGVYMQALDHITAGMEDILGHVGHNRIRVSRKL